MSKQHKIILVVVLLLTISIPYLLAWKISGEEYIFSGFLLNPIDGNSYLAKMMQGYRGEWKFRLPYTADPGEGGYLFLFYIFLGHLARWTGLPNLVIFHAARILSACFLSYTIFVFAEKVYKPGFKITNLITWLVLFGSGLGWMVVFFGITPSDFWVAETYPFLSAYSNPHFPLGLAILVQSLYLFLLPRKTWHFVVFMALGFLEAIIFPFGLVVTSIVLVIYCVWIWLETISEQQWSNWFKSLGSTFAPIISLLILGGPFLLYQIWISTQDPVLSGWNAQNLTESPALWDLLVSLSPAVLLAFYGCWIVFHEFKHDPPVRLLLVWFIAGIILIYIPTTIQRRFMLGLFIPTIMLAGIALEKLIRKHGLIWLKPLFIIFSVSTNLILLLGAFVGVITHSDQIYMSKDEYDAFSWIQANTPENALVICSPDIGSWIPAITGRRVIYGHPFETVNATQQEQEINDFFSGHLEKTQMSNWLFEKGAQFVYWSGRESSIAVSPSIWQNLMDEYQIVYQSGNVLIYMVQK